MAGTLTDAELLKIFPHEKSLMGGATHGRSRHKTRHTKGAHGRSRSQHARAKIDRQARIDPWKHVGQARGQG